MTDPMTPATPGGERVDCRTVADRPLPKGRYFHPNARSSGTCSEGCCSYYTCPDCGTEFQEELAQ